MAGKFFFSSYLPYLQRELYKVHMKCIEIDITGDFRICLVYNSMKISSFSLFLVTIILPCTFFQNSKPQGKRFPSLLPLAIFASYLISSSKWCVLKTKYIHTKRLWTFNCTHGLVSAAWVDQSFHTLSAHTKYTQQYSFKCCNENVNIWRFSTGICVLNHHQCHCFL